MERFKNNIAKLKNASEEVFLDSKKETASGQELIGEVITGEGKRRKVIATLEIIKRLLPEKASALIIKNLTPNIDTKELPFDFKKLSFCEKKIGKGYVSEVYLLESTDGDIPSYVLKIEYNTTGATKELHKVALQNKNEFEEISDMYKDVPGLIPEEYQLIGTSPKTQRPSVMTVQEFLGKDLRDIFKMDRLELIDLFQKEPNLKETFCKFMEKSQEIWEGDGKIIDFLGKANLVIAKNDMDHKLIFLDPHNISYKDKDDPDRRKGLEKRMKYLEDIFSEISEK